MSVELEIEPFESWAGNNQPLIIAGPCSAETEEQVLSTAKEIAKIKRVSVFRSGIWKPRTRPGHFEGIGEIGLKWMQTVKKETGLKLTTEVANAQHVEACLKHDIDILWIGARTSVNPFSVQEIADALKGIDIPVLVKNPINPDLALWMGALERFNKVGITKLGAIHRGFSSHEKMPFRNAPMWGMAIDLKRELPNVPIICDPSHIAGQRDLISFISQKALDLNMNGLMIETHIQPQVAWSDAAQQVTPTALGKLISELIVRETTSDNKEFQDHLAELRGIIDTLDDTIIEKISSRMKTASKIGEYKRDNNVTILQAGRWDDIFGKRLALGQAMGLSEQFMDKFLHLLHEESIRIQTEVMNKKKAKA